jgi:hypothetical protein
MSLYLRFGATWEVEAETRVVTTKREKSRTIGHVGGILRGRGSEWHGPPLVWEDGGWGGFDGCSKARTTHTEVHTPPHHRSRRDMGWWFGSLVVWKCPFRMLAQRTACSGTDLHCLGQSQQGAAMLHAESLQRCHLLVNFRASQTGIYVCTKEQIPRSPTESQVGRNSSQHSIDQQSRLSMLVRQWLPIERDNFLTRNG